MSFKSNVPAKSLFNWRTSHKKPKKKIEYDSNIVFFVKSCLIEKINWLKDIDHNPVGKE